MAEITEAVAKFWIALHWSMFWTKI